MTNNTITAKRTHKGGTDSDYTYTDPVVTVKPRIGGGYHITASLTLTVKSAAGQWHTDYRTKVDRPVRYTLRSRSSDGYSSGYWRTDHQLGPGLMIPHAEIERIAGDFQIIAKADRYPFSPTIDTATAEQVARHYLMTGEGDESTDHYWDCDKVARVLRDTLGDMTADPPLALPAVASGDPMTTESVITWHLPRYNGQFPDSPARQIARAAVKSLTGNPRKSTRESAAIAARRIAVDVLNSGGSLDAAQAAAIRDCDPRSSAKPAKPPKAARKARTNKPASQPNAASGGDVLTIGPKWRKPIIITADNAPDFIDKWPALVTFAEGGEGVIEVGYHRFTAYKAGEVLKHRQQIESLSAG